MLPFQRFQFAPSAYVGVGCQQRKQMLLFLFVMALIGKYSQELHEIGKHTWINLLAGIEQLRDRTHAGHNLLNDVVIMFQFVNEVTHGISPSSGRAGQESAGTCFDELPPGREIRRGRAPATLPWVLPRLLWGGGGVRDQRA